MPDTTDGFVLTANSAVGGGMEWAAAAGGAVAADDVSVDSTTLVGTGTDAQAVFEELDNAIADHLADAVDAHDATAISFSPAGTIAAITVQAAIEEVASEAGGGSGVDWEDVGTSGSGFGPSILTSLPGAPTDLDEIYLQVGSGDTAVYWHLKYLSAITDAYKWVFLGGGMLVSQQSTAAATASGTYVELNSGTPAVTLPAVGVYSFFHGFVCTRAGANAFGIQNIKTNGATPGDDNDSVTNKPIGADSFVAVSRVFERTVASIATSALAVCVYRTDGNSNTFTNRFIQATPVRIG